MLCGKVDRSPLSILHTKRDEKKCEEKIKGNQDLHSNKKIIISLMGKMSKDLARQKKKKRINNLEGGRWSLVDLPSITLFPLEK